jgi:hypothetical protein
MLIFLLLALWRLAIETRDMRAIAMFLAVGVSLWVPAGLSQHHAVQFAEHLNWLGCLVVLLILDRRSMATGQLEVSDPIAGAAAGSRFVT